MDICTKQLEFEGQIPTHTPKKRKWGWGKLTTKGVGEKNKGTSILFVSILAELASKTPGHDHMVINK